jgi:hypothetical protein
MAESPGLTPVEYIDRFFDELRMEVRSNPKLAARLVKALGGTVVFEDEAKAEIASPISWRPATRRGSSPCSVR